MEDLEKQVHEAANKLAEQGINPTIARVRELVGRGSYTTITPIMREWRSMRGLILSDEPSISDRLKVLEEKVDQILNLINKLTEIENKIEIKNKNKEENKSQIKATTETVSAAINKLKEEGKNITANAIRQITGGSHNTIRKIMEELNER